MTTRDQFRLDIAHVEWLAREPIRAAARARCEERKSWLPPMKGFTWRVLELQRGDYELCLRSDACRYLSEKLPCWADKKMFRQVGRMLARDFEAEARHSITADEFVRRMQAR